MRFLQKLHNQNWQNVTKNESHLKFKRKLILKIIENTVKPLKPATHGEWQTGRFTEVDRFKNQYRTL